MDMIMDMITKSGEAHDKREADTINYQKLIKPYSEARLKAYDDAIDIGKHYPEGLKSEDAKKEFRKAIKTADDAFDRARNRIVSLTECREIAEAENG